jgi:predicted component of type VI protein secretion system
MTEPHPHSTAPRPAQGNVDIDVDIDVDSNATAPNEGPAEEPALTTSKDAQRDDLLVQPGNS